MKSFFIIESGDTAGDFVRACLKRHGISVSDRGFFGYRVESIDSVGALAGVCPDVVFLTSEEISVPRERVECGIAVIPGSADSEGSAWLSAQSVVSYGMGQRDTITVSSIDDHMIMLTLQREIATLKGEMVDRQDFAVDRQPEISTEAHLIASAACIIAGIPTGELRRQHIFSR